MTTTTAPAITYRKTKAGEWVAFGPASLIHAGGIVTVTKASGETKTERIESVGRPFTVDGRQMVYGYIVKAESYFAEGRRQAETPRRPSARMCDECGERRAVTTARDLSGITGDVCGLCKRNEGGLSFA